MDSRSAKAVPSERLGTGEQGLVSREIKTRNEEEWGAFEETRIGLLMGVNKEGAGAPQGRVKRGKTKSPCCLWSS